MSEGNGAAAAVDRAEALLDQAGDSLRKTGAGIRGATHAPTEPTTSPIAAPEARPATERAEETLDRVGGQIGAFAATVGHRLRKSAALAREGAEDIWAEAQSLRRKNMPPPE